MTLSHFWSDFFHQHQELLDKNYPGLKRERFLKEVEIFFKTDLHQSRHAISSKQLGDMEKALLQGVPLAYLQKEWSFFEHDFKISPAVLIPRRETEELVEMCLVRLKAFSRPKILDVGTGSGVIGLTLLMSTPQEIDVVFSDISKEALAHAKKNVSHHEHSFPLKSTVNFILSDRLENISEQFDMIISNPPYIPRSRVKQVHLKVQEFEPDLALFLEDEQYEAWFETFFLQIKKSLRPKGCFYMEGHEDKLQELESLAKRIGFSDTILKNDLSGSVRFLVLNRS